MKTEFNNMSKREYLLIYVEQGNKVQKVLTLKDLLLLKENDFEYIYSLAEEIDNILDLEVNENFYILGSRGDRNSKGVITRIN